MCTGLYGRKAERGERRSASLSRLPVSAPRRGGRQVGPDGSGEGVLVVVVGGGTDFVCDLSEI